jgi:hypothetical protein
MRFLFTKINLYLLTILFLVFGSLILITQNNAVLNTFLLFIFISIFGLILCERLKLSLNDHNLNYLGFFWIIKLFLTLFLLFIGWMPFLDPNSPGWGYDPQRFYFQSKELIDNNWIFIGSLNYVGILYYYGAIFFLFGHNPVIPVLINSLITLIASLFIIRYVYEMIPKRQSRDWTIVWILLIPEILWYDAITSRETLIGALIIFVLITFSRMVIHTMYFSMKKSIIIILISLFLIAIVRTSMLLPVAGTTILMLLIKKTKTYVRVYQTVLFGVIVLVIGYLNTSLLNIMGGEKFDISDSLNSAMSSKDNIATIAGDDFHYSENSISSIFLPNGIIQSIIFLPARMLLYLVAPLPDIYISLDSIKEGNWQAWQKLLTILSSILNIIIFPYVLSATIHELKNRKDDFSLLTLVLSFWIVFIAISGGNLIIHERYRVMASLLLWSCAWLGLRFASPKLNNGTKFLWFGTLLIGALFYIFYKFL